MSRQRAICGKTCPLVEARYGRYSEAGKGCEPYSAARNNKSRSPFDDADRSDRGPDRWGWGAGSLGWRLAGISRAERRRSFERQGRPAALGTESEYQMEDAASRGGK